MCIRLNADHLRTIIGPTGLQGGSSSFFRMPDDNTPSLRRPHSASRPAM